MSGGKPLRSWHRRWREGWQAEAGTAAGRRRAVIDMLLFDHGLLRLAWRNLHEIDRGVLRGNQPDPAMIRRLAARGLRTILNLRGETGWGSYLLEREACRAEGVALIDFKMNSRRLPSRQQILELDRIFATAERALLMHCKSGSDRAGFAAGLYLLLRTGASVENAKAQLSWRYLHLAGAQTGVLRFLFDRYAADAAAAPMRFRDWVEHRYDPEALMAAYSSGVTADFLVDKLLRRE